MGYNYFFDGFGAHMSSVLVLEMCIVYKILSLKEEGNTSHVNQVYKNYIAKSNKKSCSCSVGVQRECIYYNCGVVDQWGLIHSGLLSVHDVNKTTWKNSFAAYNLDPRTRVDFPTWCKKIQQYLLAGDSFKAGILVDRYLLLPFWWQELSSKEKKILLVLLISTDVGRLIVFMNSSIIIILY